MNYTNIQCQLLQGIDKKHRQQKGKPKNRANEKKMKMKYDRHVCQPYFRQTKNFLRLQDEYDKIEHDWLDFLYQDSWEWQMEQDAQQRNRREEEDEECLRLEEEY